MLTLDSVALVVLFFAVLLAMFGAIAFGVAVCRGRRAEQRRLATGPRRPDDR